MAEPTPAYTGRVTVPVLWDKQRGTIVSNESSEIIRMFNSAFNAFDGIRDDLDFYPEALRADIDAVNDPIYHHINNGVYKCGFATTQEVYEEAFEALFAELDRVEERLTTNRYLMGSTLTEADWRLFTTPGAFRSGLMSDTSSATASASPTSRRFQAMCASSIRCPVSPTR